MIELLNSLNDIKRKLNADKVSASTSQGGGLELVAFWGEYCVYQTLSVAHILQANTDTMEMVIADFQHHLRKNDIPKPR